MDRLSDIFLARRYVHDYGRHVPVVHEDRDTFLFRVVKCLERDD